MAALWRMFLGILAGVGAKVFAKLAPFLLTEAAKLYAKYKADFASAVVEVEKSGLSGVDKMSHVLSAMTTIIREKAPADLSALAVSTMRCAVEMAVEEFLRNPQGSK